MFVVGLLVASGHLASAAPVVEPWGTQQVLRSSGLFHVATDGVTSVVGDYKWQTGTGEAHVYQWNGAAWVWQQTLSSPLPPPPTGGDGFGFAVEVHNDVVVVGQHAGGTASAHVFEHAAGSWGHTATISEANGRGLALWGTTIAATTDAGTVVTYDLVGGTWTSTGTLSPATAYSGCEFGYSIDLHKDVLVAGDYFSHDPCDPALHVFRRSGGVWGLEQELGAPSGNGYLEGWVAVWDDTIAVGDPDITGTNTAHVAKVHVYHWIGSSWSRVQILKRPTQNFGDSVALYDTTLVVGDATTGGTWVYTRIDDPRRADSYGDWRYARYLRDGPGTGRYLAAWGRHVLTSDSRADAYHLRTCWDLISTRVGTAGHDTISGTFGSDVILGLTGDDVLDGGNGYDIMCGGSGDDRLMGRKGNDVLIGGGGMDRLFGGAGHDRLAPMAGDDRVAGDTGFDGVTYQAVAGAVDLDFDSGVATASGSGILESLEWAKRPPGDDVLRGDGSDNTLRGIGGDDLLVGRAGDDLLRGGPGTDEARGGPGIDDCKAETKVGCK
jgi:Ca2+-binding RTX toxin-like protein